MHEQWRQVNAGECVLFRSMSERGDQRVRVESFERLLR